MDKILYKYIILVFSLLPGFGLEKVKLSIQSAQKQLRNSFGKKEKAAESTVDAELPNTEKDLAQDDSNDIATCYTIAVDLQNTLACDDVPNLELEGLNCTA